MNQLSKSNLFIVSAMTLALLLGTLTLVGCEGKTDTQGGGAPKRVPTVVVEAARREPISRLLDMTGETVAVDSVVISATVEGPISFCPWREGDRVETSPEKPAKLIEINRELYRAEVAAAEAALEVARAKLADIQAGTRPEEIAKARETVRQLEESTRFVRNDLERITKLVGSGSMPGEALEKARVQYVGEQARLSAAERHLEMLEAGYTKTAIAVQEASVKEAAARLDLAKARLNECVIFAPFSGTITRVHVRAGDMASLKTPLLEMADLSSLVIRAAVPEARASRVHEGMVAQVGLDSLPGRSFTAEVVRVYPELDRTMRTRRIELALTEPADLVPGMFARIRLALESVADSVTVPQDAVLLTPMGGQMAYTVADGKAVMRKVTTGIEYAGRVQVLSGLESGEKVVVVGNERLRDGAEIRVAEPAQSQGNDGRATGAPAAKGGGAP